MKQTDMQKIAQALVAPKKGILAADESTGTIAKRFNVIKVENTEENRRNYRDLLFTTKGFGDYISGVILYDETLRQKGRDGTPFAKVLQKAGSIPGIKVDAGTVAMTGAPEEKVTQGLDGLRERLKEYYGLGARFAKWRAVITIGDGLPTLANIQENARLLANYAALCQEQNIVPIVEPEVLMDADNTIERCMAVTTMTLHEVFDALYDHCVVLEEMLLKPNMVVSGKKCKKQASVEDTAAMTLECLRRTVPAAVPGIVFLSGGQSSAKATAHLNAMNASGPLPWQLSFSYGRALQEEALAAWRGQDKNVAAAQKVFYGRAKLNGLARSGKYSDKLEKEFASV
ncbi:MAG: fructose-bisphosphate aldolase class I [Planctomycetes bacterium]|nr:fructose-bisphosphate aldolase class I [Planctomycetota bacterium]